MDNFLPLIDKNDESRFFSSDLEDDLENQKYGMSLLFQMKVHGK